MRSWMLLTVALAALTLGCRKDGDIDPGGCRIVKVNQFGQFGWAQLARFTDNNFEVRERLVATLHKDSYFGGDSTFQCRCESP